MSWTVNFYPRETKKFLDKLSKPDRTKVLQELVNLKDFGFLELNDSLKKIAGTKNIWELKVKQYRIFLIQSGTETIQILHAIVKQTNKTPLEIIELVKARAKYFE